MNDYQNNQIGRERSKLVDWLFSKGVSGEFTTIDSLSLWKKILAEQSADWRSPIERAIAFGFKADRVAYAFIAGFRAALQYLLPDLDPAAFASFCITEKGGNHPRAIKSSLEPDTREGNTGNNWILNGYKTFITGADEAELIFAAATDGLNNSGKHRIKLVRLDRQQSGIEIQPMEPLPFIPEIGHGNVSFNNVKVSINQILPGDGYDLYIKPFRIIEEIHVLAALLGYWLRTAFQFHWEHSVIERISSLILLAIGLANLDLKSVPVHILFSGFQQQMDGLMKDLESCWIHTPQEIHQAWERDKAILNIARQARTKRLENAWVSLEADNK